MRWEELSLLTKIAFFAAVAGFFVTFEESNVTTVNDTITACSYINYGALIFGAAGAVLALVAILAGLAPARRANLMAAGGVLLLGLVQIGLGLGLIGGPCN